MSSRSFINPSRLVGRAVDDIIEQTNATYTRLRHVRNRLPQEAHGCLHASHKSATYIRDFWPQVAELIDSDPRKLGLSVPAGDGRFGVEEVKNTILQKLSGEKDERHARIMAGTMAPLTLMTRLLNEAAGLWADRLQDGSGSETLDFELDSSLFVSLRTLLSRKDSHGVVGGNAPTLVMGGTATAVAMCWNLFYQLPRAYDDLVGREIDRKEMESLWEQTKELIFRIGGGSLTAFVAFASACSSDANKMLWDGAGDLGLMEEGDRYVWMMNEALIVRYNQILKSIESSQEGHYVGCAALFTRSDPLPLNDEFADEVPSGRDPTVFSEIIRWITAVARAEYFPEF